VTTVILSAAILFGVMLLPLPSPVGLAAVLWAMAAGVSLPVVLGLYILQDVVAYLAIRRALPMLASRYAVQTAWLRSKTPARLSRLAAAELQPVSGGAGLFSASFVSFYAGAALAALQNAELLRSAALVIVADTLKYLNGLALALGAAHVLPASPCTTLAASLLGLALLPVWKVVGERLRTTTMPVS